MLRTLLVLLPFLAGHDGITYDTEDLHTFTLPCRAGKTVCQTLPLSPAGLFLKVRLEDLNAVALQNLSVHATLGS